MIHLLVITDGRRDCLERTLRSANEMLIGDFTHRLIVNDAGDHDYHEWLVDQYADQGFITVSHAERRGFAESIRTAWALLCFSTAQYVMHVEDDFLFDRPVDVTGMARVLDAHPHLAQLALLRGPVNEEERAAGGVIEQHPGDYGQVRCGSYAWREHRRHFTTNPSLYRRTLCERDWPEGENSEGRFGIDLFADGVTKAGYWGDHASGAWVTHIGERVGTGY